MTMAAKLANALRNLLKEAQPIEDYLRAHKVALQTLNDFDNSGGFDDVIAPTNAEIDAELQRQRR